MKSSPGTTRRDHGLRRLMGAVLAVAACIAVAAHGALGPAAAGLGSLSNVNPSGASAGVSISVTGTGFDPTASNNEVLFTPASGGPVSARGTAIAVVNAATGTRRLTVAVPAGLAAGPAALRVLNTISGETSEGLSLDVVEIRLSDVLSAARGASNLAVRIVGSPNSRFVAGSSRATFGAGVTVHSTAVESATSLVATISVPATATVGPRTVAVISPTQTATLSGFAVVDAPPANRNPSITSSPATTAAEGQPYAYDVHATDPDASDTLSYSLTSAPSGMTIDPASGLISWIPVATHVPSTNVTVQVLDGKGGSATQSFTIAVAAANRAPQITSTPVTTAREQLAYSYQVQATDPNGDSLTYVLKTAPAGMTISAAGLITWMPPVNPQASASVVVVVSDPGMASATQAFEIAITAAPPVNQPPRITSTPQTTGTTGQPYAYDVEAEDPDPGATLTFSLVQPPQGMSIHPATGVIAWTPGQAQTGPFAVTVRVSDGTDAVQQAYELTIAAAAPENRPPAAHAGGPYQGEAGIAVAFDGTQSNDPDSDALTYSWSFGDGTAPGSGPTPSHVFAQAGSFVVTLTVSDGHGGESVRTTTAAIGAAGDRAPPAVALLGPREVLPGDQVTLTAQATDNVKVDKVMFTVDGGAPTEATTEPFQRSIAVPPVASPGTEIKVAATATDPSGNAGSAEATLTIKARPDTEHPVVTLNAPPLAAPGTTIHVSASAEDNAGIQSVVFSINGAALVTRTSPPYEATYDIPADAPVGSTLAVGASALDFSANRSDASAPVSLIQTADTQPPTVQLTARATIVPGADLSLTVVAADNRGISAVEFYVDGVRILTDTQAPYAATFAVPAGTPSGRTLQLEARATDFAGLEGTDSRQAQVVAATSLAQGVIAGEVFDDTTSLPLAGAAIALTGTDVTGQPYTQTATSDMRGRYLLRATEGSGVLLVARVGWTRVDRHVEIVGNKSIEVLDARLTPLTPAGASINPVLGATISGPSGSQLSLAVPPGALQDTTAIALTPISQQGLQGLLPAGWSPLGAADIGPRSTAFAGPATLTVPRPSGLPVVGALVLARWDEEQSKWIAVGTRSASAPGALSLGVSGSGQYVWVLNDVAPAAPPVPVVGAALSGVTIGQIPTNATTIVSPQSKVVFYQPGVKIEVAGLVNLSSAVSSGTHVYTRLSESYTFNSGLETHLEPYVEDLVLYQAGAASSLGAKYVVTPSLSFEAATLQSGVITVEIFEPPPGPRLSDVVGDAGGSVTADTGERVDIPANGLAGPAAVVARRILASELGFVLPSALSFVGGINVSASGTSFAAPATLSIPKPAQLAAGSQVLIARVAEIGAASRLVLVAIGRVSGDRVESTTTLGSNPSAFEGPRSEGRYLFLQPASPVGFAAGLVRAVNNDPFAGALVSADTLPLFALSRATGQYVAAASTGAVALLAQDVVRNDTGTAQGTIPAVDAVLPIDVRLSAQPPQVLSIAPVNQAVNVALSDPIVVTFSEPLNPSTVTPTSVMLTGPSGAPVTATLVLSNNDSVVTLRPTAPLPPETAFTLTVAASVSDLSGYSLSQPVSSSFTSLDVTAPPPPPAGTIAASIPGTDGTSTITGTQGTAGQHDTVTIVNLTRGTTTPVLVDPSGGFSVIVQASLTDQLRLRIVDAAGNETVIALPRFSRTNADGSISVAIDKDGGRVDGPGGVSATVKPGTFPDGALVTIKPVPAAQFPVPLSAEHQEHFAFSGGVSLDFGGKVPTQYVNVSVPAGPDDGPDDRWIVSMVADFNGQQILSPIDTARVIDGKVTTSSPPCPGVTAAAVYGFYKTDRPVGVTYGVLTSVRTVEVKVLGAPWTLAAEFDQIAMCLPVLSGRVTIAPNTVTAIVNRSALTTTVDRVTVTNITRNGTKTHFTRPTFEFQETVAGSAADKFEVGAERNGAFYGISFKVSPARPGFVTISLPLNDLTLKADEIVISNETTNQDTVVAGESLALRFKVAGGLNDDYGLQINDPVKAGPTSALMMVFPSDLGPGNLVARALPKTIDPSQAEIDAYNATHFPPLFLPARTKVEIVNRTSGAAVEIPAASIVEGGFAHAFDGSLNHDYAIRVSYADNSTDEFNIPIFRLTMADSTGTIVRNIVLPTPPPDEPLNLGTLTDDNDPPKFVGDLFYLDQFDASDFPSFVFSEAMDAKSVKESLILVDEAGDVVEAEVRLSNGNTVATIVPKVQLALGKTYTVMFSGVTDRGGNELLVTSLSLTTTAPRLVSSFQTNPGPTPIQDMQIWRREIVGGETVYLVATTDRTFGNAFIVVDATDPAKLVQKGSAVAGFNKKELQLITGINGLATAGPNPCRGGPSTFTGDMGVTTSFTSDFTYLSFFDITDPSAPCLMSNKLLTATPDLELFEAVQVGTYHVFGAGARGVAIVPHAQGFAAYAAIPDAGLFVADIGPNIPDKRPRVREPMLSGSYFDVATYGNRLLALNRWTQALEIIDPSLTVVASLILPDYPRRITITPGFPFDTDGNGIVESGESITAVFIGGDKSLMMADATNPIAPRLIARIPLPFAVRDMDVDPFRRRVLVADVRDKVMLVDVTRTQTPSLLDKNLDGIDDRIAWSRQYTYEVIAVRLDPERPNFYIGSARGIDVFDFGAPNLRGTAKYTYIPLNTDRTNGRKLGLDYASADELPIRGAIVELRRGSGELLQTTTTDDAGAYSFDAPKGVEVEVVVKAALGTAGDIHFDVIDNVVNAATNPKGNRVWSKSSGKFTVGSNTEIREIVAKTEWKYHPAGPGLPGNYEVRDGAPFAILDTVHRAEKVVRVADPERTFPLLHVAWSPDNRPALQAQPGGGEAINYAAGYIGEESHYSESRDTIFLLGRQNVDTDEYDRGLVLHEWSHYFLAKFSRSDSIGGTHGDDDLLDPRVAFDEGFATAHGAMVGGVHEYVDTSGFHQADLYDVGLEKDRHTIDGYFSEESVAQLVWDLFDEKSDFENPDIHRDDPPQAPVVQSGDAVSLGYLPIYRAVVGGQRTTRAFTTIVSFLKYLLDLPVLKDPAQVHDVHWIRERARAEGINLGDFDEYEIATRRMYTVLPVDGSVVALHGPGPHEFQALQTRRANDPDRDNNKLDNHVFFKLTVTEAATYDITVITVMQAQMRIMLSDGGKETTKTSDSLGGGTTLSATLAPGEYVVDVSDASNYGTGPGLAPNVIFQIRAAKKP